MGWFRRKKERRKIGVEEKLEDDVVPPLLTVSPELTTMITAVQEMQWKPPVTLMLLGVMYLLHVQVKRTPSVVLSFALCPSNVLANKEIGTVLVAPFIHGEELHLYQSMVSFLYKGFELERRFGSIGFSLVLIYFIVLTQTLIVFIAHYVSMGAATRECFTGFSGVLTAMKVLLNVNVPTFTKLYTFKVPTKYTTWLELLVTYFFVPKLPIMAQAAGLIAGSIYIVTPKADALVRYASKSIERSFIRMGLLERPLQWWQLWAKVVEYVRQKKRRRVA